MVIISVRVLLQSASQPAPSRREPLVRLPHTPHPSLARHLPLKGKARAHQGTPLPPFFVLYIFLLKVLWGCGGFLSRNPLRLPSFSNSPHIFSRHLTNLPRSQTHYELSANPYLHTERENKTVEPKCPLFFCLVICLLAQTRYNPTAGASLALRVAIYLTSSCAI